MGIMIFFRKQAKRNWFRELIIQSLKTGTADSAIICSGFFQEFFKTSTYQASNEGKFSSVVKSKKISITTIGIHNGNWITPYKNFRNNLLLKGIKIKAKIAKKFHWHAKIFILKKKNLK